MNNDETKDSFQAAQLMLLVGYTILAASLILESFLMGWEKWALIPIGVGIIASWIIHVRQLLPTNVRLWFYSVLMMCSFFFYGIHETSTFDLAVVISAIMVLYTLTGQKKLIDLALATYYVTMAYGIIKSSMNEGFEFDALTISRIVLHCVLIFMIGWFSKTVIDRWSLVLNKSKDEILILTDATERLNDFLANVSHELRTPVNAVIGLSGICIDKEDNDAIRRDMISVRNAGRKVAEQIGDILDYSEIDRKKIVVNNEDYMLSSILNDLIVEIREYKSKDVELVIDVDPSIPSVMNSDAAKIKKILRALISNGLKYTHEGGVYVRISSEEKEYGVNLLIEVTDTGIGMSEEELERVYERFYQVDSGRARLGGGLGLGLSIVSGFVSVLGGFMIIKSKPDVGTSVHVSLPQSVVDSTSCMSVANPEKLCLGAYLHFEKFPNPSVREYYNAMVLNIVKGLGVQMHRVDNTENLKRLKESLNMTHLFVGEEEYCSDIGLMEELAKDMIVVVVANGDFVLPARSGARIMEKPFYCFPVVTVLNSNLNAKDEGVGRLYCNGVRALVVDDEPMNLVVAKSIFKRYKMIVSTAASGQESIDMCREKQFDIVFMDHMMGGMDGVEAMKRIRADVSGLANNIPIVALTANAMSSAKQMFLSEGFDGFVSKPIETEELERVLKQVLPKSSISFEFDENDREENETVDDNNRNPEGTKPESPKDDPREGSSLSEKLENSGIDIESGLKYCLGDEEFYTSLLLQFAKEADEKISSLLKFYEEKDWGNYEIVVHALKSTSKMIGAKDLSEEALKLEKAAKEKRDGYIIENHMRVMSEYEILKEKISYALDDNADAADSNTDILEFKPEETEEDDGIIEFESADTFETEDETKWGFEREESENNKAKDGEVLEFEPVTEYFAESDEEDEEDPVAVKEFELEDEQG
ncbi:MAG: response regulator [Lachnospiraceae bacterium]|nr:response regulator [Lachnospiraceae bacterium]